MTYIGSPPSYNNFPIVTLTGDGTTKSFNLPYYASSSGSILVTIDGLHAYASTYRANGQAITFTTAPGAGAKIEILFLGSPAVSQALASVTSVGLLSNLSGITVGNSPVTSSGIMTLDGILNVSSGGTGQNVFTPSALIVGTNTEQLASLPTGAAGQLLKSNGIGVNPAWANTITSFSAGNTGFAPAVSTTGDVVLSGTLQVDNGGTNRTSFRQNSIVLGGITTLSETTNVFNYGDTLSYLSAGTPPVWTDGNTVSHITSNLAGITIGYTQYTGAGVPNPLHKEATFGGTLGLASGGTGLATSTANALLVGGSPTLQYVPVGSDGQILRANAVSTNPSWANPGDVAVGTFSGGTTGFTPSMATKGNIVLDGTLLVKNGGTGAASFTAKQVLYGNGTLAIQATSGGTAGQVLTIASGNNLPTWQNNLIPVGSGIGANFAPAIGTAVLAAINYGAGGTLFTVSPGDFIVCNSLAPPNDINLTIFSIGSGTYATIQSGTWQCLGANFLGQNVGFWSRTA